jgi:NADH-quinone oxidoreductase subunit H
MVYGSLQLDHMASWQAEHWWGIFPQAETAWYPGILIAFVLYFTAAIAETKRVPFDVPEGESELVGGYLTEYSGMKFGMFFMSEFVEVVALAAIAVVLFFGGWDVPLLYADGFHVPEPLVGLSLENLGWTMPAVVEVQHWLVIAIQVTATLVKISLLIWFQLMIRWSLPRFRYDQIMKLCWKGLLPLALGNILLTGLFILWQQAVVP